MRAFNQDKTNAMEEDLESLNESFPFKIVSLGDNSQHTFSQLPIMDAFNLGKYQPNPRKITHSVARLKRLLPTILLLIQLGYKPFL